MCAIGCGSMKQHFAMFASYNRWANAQLYVAAAALTDEEFVRDVGAFFGSMRGTLNHILTADRIWLKRFTGMGDAPTALDAMPYPVLADLRTAREVEDTRIITWTGGLTDQELGGQFTYFPITDPSKVVTQRLMPALGHFFNHQTHHRGQAHTILTALGKPSLSLDLIYFQRTDEGKAFA